MFIFYWKDLRNAGKPCLNECDGKQGYCSYCGTGVCCRQGDELYDGCRGAGGEDQHECVESGNLMSNSNNYMFLLISIMF